MVSILWITGAVLLGMHGLIHLMGFFAYWPLALIPDLTYKTTILAGQVDLQAIGMRAYSILWLIPALGFIAVATAIILRWARWQQVFDRYDPNFDSRNPARGTRLWPFVEPYLISSS